MIGRKLFGPMKVNFLFSSDGRQYCWKKPTESPKDRHVISTVK